jgi:hypothetical protein
VTIEPPTGDAGEADPGLVAALAGGDVVAIRRALLVARVLMPVVALGEGSDAVEMAVPRLIGSDGRHALPIFSSYHTLRAWRADARPMPMPGDQAIAAAVGEGYDAVILDVAGPVSHVVELGSLGGGELGSLAGGELRSLVGGELGSLVGGELGSLGDGELASRSGADSGRPDGPAE